MTKDGWKELVIKAVRDHDGGNDKSLELLAAHLAETDEATQLLRDKGYGRTGLGLLEAIDQRVPYITDLNDRGSVWVLGY